MSLSCQSEDCSSLSPDSSWPLAVPRRTSARSRNETADDEVFVIVTVVARSAPLPRTIAAPHIKCQLVRILSKQIRILLQKGCQEGRRRCRASFRPIGAPVFGKQRITGKLHAVAGDRQWSGSAISA